MGGLGGVLFVDTWTFTRVNNTHQLERVQVAYSYRIGTDAWRVTMSNRLDISPSCR